MVKLTNKKNKIRKPLFFGSLLVLVLASLVLVLFVRRHNKSAITTKKPTQTDSETINYAPPTEQDRTETENNKERIAEEDKRNASQPAQTPGTKKVVTPVITYAGQYGPQVEVGGYVPGIFELGGTCTAMLTRGAKTITKTVDAVREGNSVDCPTLAVNNSEFPEKGTWTVKLCYNSSTAAGTSGDKQVEVK